MVLDASDARVVCIVVSQCIEYGLVVEPSSNPATDAEQARRIAQARPTLAASAGGGGDGSDAMQGRVQRLEEDLKEVKSDLKAALKDLSYLRGKADGSPSTLQLIGFAVAVFVAAGITRWFGH